MTPALAAARDPLASEQSPGDAPLIARRRRSVQTPSVTAINGAEAVTQLRGCGLIAAIESVTVSDDLPTGWVLSQDPPAGTPLDREAVVALQLVAPPEADVASESQEPVVGNDTGDDDTEQWFHALAEEPASPRATNRGRRKRKPGRATNPAGREDAPPPEPYVNGRASALDTRAKVPRRFPFTRWRTVAALLTGTLVIVGLVGGLGGSRSHMSGQKRAHVTRPVTHRVAAPPAPLPARASRVPHRAGHSSKPRRARRRARAVARRGDRDRKVAVAHAAGRDLAPGREAHPAAAPTQFAYLGQ